MKTMTIAFSKPKSKWAIGSILIRAIEKSPFSHAIVRWHSASLDRDMVYQASHGMAHFMEGSRFDAETEIMTAYQIELTDEEFTATVQKCVDLAGVKYGLFQLWGMGLERLTGIRNPWRDGEQTFVCSELVGDLLSLSEGTVPLDLELAGPKQLEVWVAALPNAVKIK